MVENQLGNEKQDLLNQHRKVDEELRKFSSETKGKKRRWDQTESETGSSSRKRSRWDATPSATPGAQTPGGYTPGATPSATPGGSTPSMTPGGATPGSVTPGGATPGSATPGGATPGGATPGGATPGGVTPGGATPGTSRWDATPGPSGDMWGRTPSSGMTPGASRSSRWDSARTPSANSSWGATPATGRTPSGFTPSGATPGTPGAITPGQATPGGITPGAQTPSGFTPGGQTPSGFTPGGSTPSGFTPGAITPASRTPGGGMWGDTPGGARTPGGRTPGGRTPGGRTPGGRTPGGRTPGYGATPGSRTPGLGYTPGRWDTPGPFGSTTPGAFGSTPYGTTPMGGTPGTTPGGKRRRWDETPDMVGKTPTTGTPGSRFTPGTPRTPGTPATPGSVKVAGTPVTPSTPRTLPPTPADFLQGMAQTPSTPTTPDQIQNMRIQHDIYERNKPLTDPELEEILPSNGYRNLETPKDYEPIRTPARLWGPSPTPGPMEGFEMPVTPGINSTNNADYGVQLNQEQQELPFIKPEEMQIFRCLLDRSDEDVTDPHEQKDRRILTLLLKVKNGTPPQRKNALRQLSDNAREFGAEALFDRILPLLMQPTLEDQERHLLVKVIDRVLYKLDDLVRPYAHKILVVIEPLLIDEDYYARVEGREIIANLAKAAGLATMISTMRPDIDNVDEYVRNTTARAFSVVASALGIQSLLPFLKAVCQSKKSWQARHTGIKIVQQIAILMGCAVLPHLRSLVEIIEGGLNDEQSKVRTITALAVAALAEAAHPYGIEAFDTVLKPLWMGITKAKGGTKTKAAFLKAIGYIIPLMDAEYAGYYTREVMPELIAEFNSPDEEMKKIVLKVVKQCVGSDGVEAPYVKQVILGEFFKAYWNRRMALDRRNYKQLVQTTVEIAQKVGGSEIINNIVEDLRDENESYRKMVMETIDSIVEKLGVADVDQKLEEFLIDGILYAFQEQTGEDSHVMLKGFGTVVNSLGIRTKPYLPQICGIINFRLNNKSARVRQQAADLVGRIATVLKVCKEESLLKDLGKTLFEFLGEEYPDVLGSIIGALKAVVNELGMQNMNPPIKDLLPRLTPIMKNRHEKVQENTIDLVGRIADRGAEYVTFKEWMRIAHELLDMLKAHKKAIRRATVNTFGYIAKALGPLDVLEILLNNLRVQERQNRVCTTVAIAIVAETCAPFTVLPALMNEYRVPELNVQNGVLKSLSFLFEYIGEMGKDYVYAVTPLFEDALMDRDLVHRQTACAAIKHMSLGCYGMGREDALQHLLNYVWPNIFETSPHVINAVHEALEGMRVSLGSHILLQYTLQGLFHPARKVRNAYWKVYNSLYIGAQDALVAAYPCFDSDAEVNNYKRDELFQFI